MSEKSKTKTLYYFNKSFIEKAIEIIKFELRINDIYDGYIISQIPGDTEDKKSAMDISALPMVPQTEEKIHEIIQRYHWGLIKGSGYMCHVVNTMRLAIPSEPKEGEADKISFPEFLSNILAGLERKAAENKSTEKVESPDVMRINHQPRISPKKIGAMLTIKRLGNEFHDYLSNVSIETPGHEKDYFRELKIAQDKIEEAVMWAVKGVTK